MILLYKIFLCGFYFLPVAFLEDPCKQSVRENVTHPLVSKIIFSTSGGRTGNYESLEITADSLFYTQARRGDEKTRKEKTKKDFWNKLTKAINLKDFGKIKSDPGHALFDGIDTTLSIETRTEKHTIVNGNGNQANFKKIKPFIVLLESKLGQLRKALKG